VEKAQLRQHVVAIAQVAGIDLTPRRPSAPVPDVEPAKGALVFGRYWESQSTK
jgi:hypothetical protein